LMMRGHAGTRTVLRDKDKRGGASEHVAAFALVE